jgi:hypothetical protein
LKILAILDFDHVLTAGLAAAFAYGTPRAVWLGRDMPPLFVPVLMLVELTDIGKAANDAKYGTVPISLDRKSAGSKRTYQHLI